MYIDFLFRPGGEGPAFRLINPGNRLNGKTLPVLGWKHLFAFSFEMGQIENVFAFQPADGGIDGLLAAAGFLINAAGQKDFPKAVDFIFQFTGNPVFCQLHSILSLILSYDKQKIVLFSEMQSALFCLRTAFSTAT